MTKRIGFCKSDPTPPQKTLVREGVYKSFLIRLLTAKDLTTYAQEDLAAAEVFAAELGVTPSWKEPEEDHKGV